MSAKWTVEIFVLFAERVPEDEAANARERLEWNDRIRFAAFRDAAASESFLLWRILALRALSDFAPGVRLVPPFRLPGPPTLSDPEWSLSISHTRGLTCVALARWVSRIWIDVERIRHVPNPEILEIVRNVSSAAEIESMRWKSDVPLQYFFLHWTLKESFAKAVWLGLSFPFRSVTFLRHGGAGLELRHPPDAARPTSRWDSVSFLAWSEYRFSMSVERRSDEPLRPDVAFLGRPLRISDVRSTSRISIWTGN